MKHLRMTDHDGLVELVCSAKGQDGGLLKSYFTEYAGEEAAAHLFRVACGLESQVLGEDQVLAQVKEAHETALGAGTCGAVLNTLFREAVTTAKKVKTDTELSRNPVSTASLAVKLAVEAFGGQLRDRTALIIGAGRIGSIALKNLQAKGIGRIYVTKRIHGKLMETMPESGSESAVGEFAMAGEEEDDRYENTVIVDYNDRYRYIKGCDIVISATESPHYTITREALEKAFEGVAPGLRENAAEEAGDGNRKVFIDLAVPRDIDGDISKIEGIGYFNIDDLKSAADENRGRREEEAVKAGEMIVRAVEGFEKWYEFNAAVPVIREIRRFADGVVEERTDYALGRIRNAGGDEGAAIRAAVKSAVNEVLNKLVFSIREKGSKEDIQAYFKYLREAVSGNGRFME